ncbi:MAG: hypothetical protein HY862_15815 [Chloroflexi bacterium]|nr:hypothetical protein [Chloroflexota bacterium]
MKNKRQRRRVRTQYMITAGLGLAVTFIFIIQAVLPRTNNGTTSTSVPTSQSDVGITPEPTSLRAPTLESGIPQITVLDSHLNSTGLFQFFQPGDDWYMERDDYNTDYRRASTVYISPSRLSVIHAFVEIGTNYPSLQAISDTVLTDVYFNTEWGQYKSWRYTNRQVTDSLITIDFALEDDRNELLKYIGRQISWLENDWLYTVRIVVPDNNPVLLDRLFELSMPTMVGYHNIGVFPLLGWKEFSDQSQRMMIKLQEVWTQIGGSSGRPITYAGATLTEGYEVTIQRIPGQPLESLEAAQTWLSNFRIGIQIVEGRPTTQTFAQGYWFSYTYNTVEGDPVSAAASLLNDTDGNLYFAELRTPERDANFLATDLTEQRLIGQQIIESFTVLAPIGYSIVPGTTGQQPAQPSEATTQEAATPESDTAPEATAPFGG